MSNVIYLWEERTKKDLSRDREPMDVELSKKLGKINQSLHKIEQQIKSIKEGRYENEQ